MQSNKNDADYVNKKCYIRIPNVFCLFESLWIAWHMPSFKSIAVFYPKKSVGIHFTELIKPSNTLNYKPFFKHCTLQTILQELLLFIFRWNKIFYSKNWSAFYFCLIWFRVALSVTVLKVLYSWYSLCKVIENQEFFSYSRYNLLEMFANIYFRHCLKYYIVQDQSIAYVI